jgi:hypothetical protein
MTLHELLERGGLAVPVTPEQLDRRVQRLRGVRFHVGPSIPN